MNRHLRGLTDRIVSAVRPLLVDKVERDHRQTDREFRRRRIVVGLTLVAGATLLWLSFSVRPGDNAFYPLTLGLASCWLAGSVLSGPLHLGHVSVGGSLRRPILAPVVLGLILSVIFVLGALIIRTMPWLAGYTEDVLAYARFGILPVVVLITLLNGVSEELFFRGALFAAIGVRHPVAISTTVYAATTIAGQNPVLVLAAALLGTVVGLQRRAGGGVLAPILTHLTWSLVMLFALPPLFAGAGG